MKSIRWPHAGLLVVALLLGASMAYAQGTQLLVSNVQVQQRQFTATWDVTYDLETVGDLPVWVDLFLSTDAGTTYPNYCRTVTGDVGAGVLPGSDKHIVWDAGTDFPDFMSATCQLRVTAYDGGNVEDFVHIAPGTFTMGSPAGEPGGSLPWETQHEVTLTHGIYVQTTEVTNQQYMEMAQWAYDHGHVTATSDYLFDNLEGSTQILKILGSGQLEVSFSAGVFSCVNPTHPVQSVSWYGSAAYCDWLSLRQGLPRAYDHYTWQCNEDRPYTAAGYRLPTEAEWEYACRAGTTTAFANGAITQIYCDPLDPNLNLMGWYCGNAELWTHPVAQKLPNAWGLYDMHGNVYEWCNDWCNAYGGTVTDPEGPEYGSYRVLRGGDWSWSALFCRSAWRYCFGEPDDAYTTYGFRPVRSANLGGTITINAEPNSLGAPWQITGPNAFSESGYGDTDLEDIAPGSYTLTWGALIGWTTPSPATVTQTMVTNETLTFTGAYVEVPVGFVFIPAGTFIMGSPTTELLRTTDETQHQVTLTHGIYVQTTEVTNQQYMDLAQWAYDHGYATATSTYLYDNLDGSTQILKRLGAESYEMTFSAGVFSCINPTHPVKWVTWSGSVAYCDWLSLQQGLPRAYSHSTWQCNGGLPYTAAGYRLPTEAEWEYACRAGTQTPFNTGSCLDAGSEANYDGRSPYTGCPTGPYVGWTVPVGDYPANAFGLYDMPGNLYEWCNDWYGDYSGTVTDPVGSGAGSVRVLRGGYWYGSARVCRSAFRYYDNPLDVAYYIGFRPVRSAN